MERFLPFLIIACGLLYAFGVMESFNKTNRLPPPPDMVGCGYHGTSGCDGNCASCASAPKRDPRRSLEGRG